MGAAVPALLALGYWRRHPGRALLMWLGVAVGIALLGAGLLVNDALQRTYAGFTRGVLGWTEIEVRATAQRGFAASWAERVAELPEVGTVAPVVERRSYLFQGEEQLPVNVRGVDPEAEQALRPLSLVAGRALEPGDGAVTLLSYAAALELGAGPGSDVALLTPSGMELLRVIGVYHPLGADLPGERAALTTLPQAQALFEGGREVLTRVDVATAGAPVAQAATALRQLMGGAAEVVEAEASAGQLASASRGLRTLLILAGVLALIGAATLMTVYVRAMLEERSADLALLHDLGAPRGLMRRWLSAEVALLLGLAALPGVPLAAPTARLVLGSLPDGLLPFAASLAALRPLPAALLAPSTAWLLVGALTALGVGSLLARLLRGCGRALQAAEGGPAWVRLTGNLLERRHPQAATVAAALAVTVAGLIGIHGVADASRRALAERLDAVTSWDLRVASGPSGSVPLPSSSVERVAALPGVAAVAAERQATVTSRGEGMTVIALGGFGFETGGRLSVVQAADLRGSSALAGLGRGQGVAVSVPLARRLELGVGDRLPLMSQGGEREYTVVAVVDDRVGEGEAVYLSIDEYARAWGDRSVDSLSVRLTPGTEASAVLAAVGASRGGSLQVPLHITLADAYRAELLNGVRGTFGAARLVVLVAVLAALTALLANGLAAAWSVAPELEELRELGVPRTLLARVLIGKTALTGAVGALAGAVLGTLLSLRLSYAFDGASAAWSWPAGAYGTVAVLLAATTAVAALLLSYRLKPA